MGRVHGGNFEENQQLNDSMSISPLYTTVSIDLHVRTPVGPPPVFQQASPSSCKDHHLSGCIRINFAQILQKNSDRQNVPGPFLIDPFHPIHFHYAFFGFLTTILSTLSKKAPPEPHLKNSFFPGRAHRSYKQPVTPYKDEPKPLNVQLQNHPFSSTTPPPCLSLAQINRTKDPTLT